jgi:hypothetical protein
MLNLIVIALSLTMGPDAAQHVKSHTLTIQNSDGSYTVRYSNEKSAIGSHNRTWERGRFAADEGANGEGPAIVRKSL